MVLEDAQLDHTESQVLAELDRSQHPYPPRELINRLQEQQDISEPLVRAAIWYLIDRHQVELTRDRMLRRLEAPEPGDVMVGAGSR